MANTILTPSIIAREALMILTNNTVMSQLVYRDYSEEYVKVGDTITVRKPARFTLHDFIADNSQITVQNITEQAVPVQMNKHKDISFAITAKELTLTISDFAERFLKSVMVEFAQDIDATLCALYKDIPYYYGTAGSTPKVLTDITRTRKVLGKNKCPITPRSLVLDPDAQAELSALDIFNNFDATVIANNPDALNASAVGKVQGFNTYMDQNIVAHTAGNLAGAATLTLGAAGTTGALASGGNATTIKQGDVFTIANTAGTYTCTADATTAADGTGTLTFYPATPGAVAGQVITVIGSHTANLAFHPNAFALVSRPLEKPMGPVNCAFVDMNGFTLRVVIAYDATTKRDVCSVDLLYGVKTMYPELAARLIG